MSETEIEISCVGIGQKLVSVDQKVSTIMVMVVLVQIVFSIRILCDLCIFKNSIVRIFINKTDTWILMHYSEYA